MTQEQIDLIQDEEAARWQARIEQTIRGAGLTPCDASGCDSGDPLDWTDTQVSHALNELQDRFDALVEALPRCCAGIYSAAPCRRVATKRGDKPWPFHFCDLHGGTQPDLPYANVLRKLMGDEERGE